MIADNSRRTIVFTFNIKDDRLRKNFYNEGLMGYSNQFFRAIGVEVKDRGSIMIFSKTVDIPMSRLCYYNENNILPTGTDLEKIVKSSKITETKLMLKMGRLSHDVLEAIQERADSVYACLEDYKPLNKPLSDPPNLAFETNNGTLYRGDCLSLMRTLENESVDLVFADPPFNLKKLYPSNIDDNLKAEKYIDWCQEWLSECVRILKHGGSIFLWNLPKWNAIFSDFLSGTLTFKHWIAVDIKYRLPIQGRLYPSHYSLLYYVKGQKPNVFHPDRLPMQTCPNCYGDLKDYGGYKDKMNPRGVNITDIWHDIPPVRHAKYKRRNGANELSLKLLDRVIEMSSDEGDIVFDPFGGAGTTYMAAELKNRRWLGVELGPVDDIIQRFGCIEEERRILSEYRNNINSLFPEKVHKKRTDLNLWTCESIRKTKSTLRAI